MIEKSIAGAGPWLFLAAMAASCFSRALSHVFYGLVAFAALLFLVLGRGRGWRERLPPGSLAAAAGFFLVILAGVPFSSAPSASLAHLAGLAYLLAAPCLFLCFAGGVRRGWFFPVFAAANILGAAGAFCDYWIDNVPGARASGSLGIMDYAGVLEMSLPFAFALAVSLLEKGDRRGAGLFIFVFLIDVAGLMLNNTRIAWIGVSAGCAVVALQNLGRLSWRVWLALGLAAAMVAGACLARRDIRERLFSIADVRTNASNLIRLTLWRYAWASFLEEPLAGKGLHALPAAVLDDNLRVASVDPAGWQNAHQTYLQFLAETGVFGLAAFLGLFAPSVMLACRNLRSPDGERRLWAGALASCVLVLMIHCLTDYVFNIKPMLHLFGCLAASAWDRLS